MMPVAGRRVCLVREIPDESVARAHLAQWLVQRFFVRFHIALILAFAMGVGLLTTRLFFYLGMQTMHWRWPLSLFFAYGGFLLGVRLWLSYVGLGRYLERSNTVDVPDFNISASDGHSCAANVCGDASSAGHGFDLDFLSIDEAVIPLAVIALILAALLIVLGCGVYVVWQAPFLLAEAAFEAAMAAGLIRSVRRMDSPGWMGGALKASWKPFLLILVFALMTAAVTERFVPQAHTLLEAIRLMSQLHG